MSQPEESTTRVMPAYVEAEIGIRDLEAANEVMIAKNELGVIGAENPPLFDEKTSPYTGTYGESIPVVARFDGPVAKEGFTLLDVRRVSAATVEGEKGRFVGVNFITDESVSHVLVKDGQDDLKGIRPDGRPVDVNQGDVADRRFKSPRGTGAADQISFSVAVNARGDVKYGNRGPIGGLLTTTRTRRQESESAEPVDRAGVGRVAGRALNLAGRLVAVPGALSDRLDRAYEVDRDNKNRNRRR